MRYLQGMWLITRFFFKQMGPLHGIVAQMPSITTVSPKLTQRLVLDRAPGVQYNQDLEKLQQQLRKLTGNGPNFRSVLVGMAFIRLLSIVCAYLQLHVAIVLLVAATQFVVAPYSLVVCACRLLVNAQEMFVHYFSAWVVSKVLSCAGISMMWPVRTTVPVIIAFTLVDQAFCCMVYFAYGKQLPWRRLLKHFCFGFLNTKTYYILCFLIYQDTPIDLLQLLITGVVSFMFVNYGGLALLQSTLQIPAFPLIFYQQHRIGHLPGISPLIGPLGCERAAAGVYQCAHKMHHYLHDSTPFDAMVYGEGMAEQFGWLLVEVAMTSMMGLPPYILSPNVLHLSVSNKFGHSRYGLEGFDMHADHHTIHNKNFGSEYQVPFEVYMQTQHLQDPNDSQCRWFNHTIKRLPIKDGDNTVTIELTPCESIIPSNKMTRFDAFSYIPCLNVLAN